MVCDRNIARSGQTDNTRYPGTVYARREIPGYSVPAQSFEKSEHLRGPDAKHDPAIYHAVHFTEETAPRDASGGYLVQPGKYLVDDAGAIRYLVDPGINGTVDHRDPAPGATEGTPVRKFDAPKARLMSLIIDGILTRKLPWGLVLLGVFIAIVLELSGISALPFAVGVYLPISASTPIWVGGGIRWLVEKKTRMNPAESDSSPGVLLSSGFIAGGAIAGMVLAIVAGANEDFSNGLGKVGDAIHLGGSDLASLMAFALLAGFLYQVGRGKLLAAKR